jgi:hypothetical protein
VALALRAVAGICVAAAGWSARKAQLLVKEYEKARSSMCRSDVTQEPCSVICLWISSSDTAKVMAPPSPTKAQRPQVRVFSSAVTRAAPLPEQSMLASQPRPSVSS